MGFSSDVLIAHGLSPMYDAELRYIYILIKIYIIDI